ncbi:cell division protein PerM [Granulicoccus sp. GXG6511]|uniref:cell division protein PerM n=1 Tax=Granulicoccus sp. GXG6511 TaxID=3381351 RepID=UPI003D7DD479
MSSDFRRRTRNRLRLKVRTAGAVPDSGTEPPRPGSRLPAWAAAILTGAGAGVAGWLIVCLVVVINWLTSLSGDIGPVFGAATQIWLLAHGGGLSIGGVRWTLIPLGLTALILLVAVGLISGLVHRAVSADSLSRRTVLRLLALVGAGYVVVVGGAAAAFGSWEQTARAVSGAVALVVVAALWGAGRVVDLGLVRLLPEWARPVPAAAVAAVWTVLAGGAAVLATGIVMHRERITAIADGLGADPGSTAQLVLAQAAFWPNLLIWAGAWALGAGFTLGDGTVVSPPATDVGLVPSIPVLGAMPVEPGGNWMLAWLLIGVVAGALAGWVVLRRRSGARLDETAGVSFLAGLAALIAVTLLSLVARGDLGVARLTGLGPRIPELLLLAGPLLTLPAVTVGLIGGLVRQVRGNRSDQVDGEDGEPPEDPVAEPTRVLETSRVNPAVSAMDDDEPTIITGR